MKSRQFERDNIRQMAGYTSGEQPDDADTLKLNTNENPFPPSPAVARALADFDAASLRRYPQPDANPFRDAAARLHGIDRDQIIATRGGDELLRLVITTYVAPGETIAMSHPTYSLYPVLAQIQDADILSIELTDAWDLPEDFAERANQNHAKLTFIVNPHAPSGRLRSVEQIRRIAAELNGLLLVDEAYVDFIDPDLGYSIMELINEFSNIIILRSMSKGYSLAGLRFGYGIGPASLIDPMRTKTRDSYNLDAISQALALAAIQDQSYARQTWQTVRTERKRLRDQLENLGFSMPDSQANFVLATVPKALPSAPEIYHSLKQSGVLVRYFDDPRLNDKLRITIGTSAQNEVLVTALQKLA